MRISVSQRLNQANQSDLMRRILPFVLIILFLYFFVNNLNANPIVGLRFLFLLSLLFILFYKKYISLVLFMYFAPIWMFLRYLGIALPDYLITFFVFVLAISNFKKIAKIRIEFRKISIILLIYLSFLVASFLISEESVLSRLRSFFVYISTPLFFVVVLSLDISEKETIKIIKHIKILALLNIVMVFVQAISLGAIGSDGLGGIFGVTGATNISGLFMVMVQLIFFSTIIIIGPKLPLVIMAFSCYIPMIIGGTKGSILFSVFGMLLLLLMNKRFQRVSKHMLSGLISIVLLIGAVYYSIEYSSAYSYKEGGMLSFLTSVDASAKYLDTETGNRLARARYFTGPYMWLSENKVAVFLGLGLGSATYSGSLATNISLKTGDLPDAQVGSMVNMIIEGGYVIFILFIILIITIINLLFKYSKKANHSQNIKILMLALSSFSILFIFGQNYTSCWFSSLGYYYFLMAGLLLNRMVEEQKSIEKSSV